MYSTFTFATTTPTFLKYFSVPLKSSVTFQPRATKNIRYVQNCEKVQSLKNFIQQIGLKQMKKRIYHCRFQNTIFFCNHQVQRVVATTIIWVHILCSSGVEFLKHSVERIVKFWLYHDTLQVLSDEELLTCLKKKRKKQFRVEFFPKNVFLFLKEWKVSFANQLAHHLKRNL